MKPLVQLLPIPEPDQSPNRDSASGVYFSLVCTAEWAAQVAVVVEDVVSDTSDAVADPDRVMGDQEPSANCGDDAADPEVPPMSEMAAVSTSKAETADKETDTRAQNTARANDTWMKKRNAESSQKSRRRRLCEPRR